VILGAGLLVLAGLGLFVAGILTGGTVLYWGCVAACVVAAVFIFLARRRLGTAQPDPAAGAQSSGKKAPGTKAPDGTSAERPAVAAAQPAPESGGATAVASGAPAAGEVAEPGVEEVEVTDLLVVVDLTDEVLVVDEHPRYHVAGCSWLAGRETIPLPLDEARTDGFTPCAVCSPDRTLAERARARR
jgi:hypothetical protein